MVLRAWIHGKFPVALISKEVNNMDMKVHQHKKSIHAALRIVVALLLLVTCFSPLMRSLEGSGYGFRDGLNEFLFAFIPTVAIVILLPAAVRGAVAEKIVAIVFLLPSVFFAFVGWGEIVGDFIDTYFRH
jgi:hypothetical protein